ncbi:profilin [Streptomyces sp. 8L]|uniref:profilin n=1 Tax=Streptomyces sp. 8L TaxID=2877242 RepID=UPI001CD4D8D2|nr:profilin [Streptomyces sp. 8L]MCA1218804.1 profilin [Streptomyces sp. 8L]
MATLQEYVDKDLVGTNNVRRAAIIRADDGGTLAESDGGLLRDGEGADIIALFRDPSEVRAKGVVVGGEQFAGVKGDEKSICATKGADGIAIARTDRSIIIGFYQEGEAPCDALLTVGNVADSLREDGY